MNNPPFFRNSAIVLVIWLVALPALQAQGDQRILPVGPAILLKALPPSPPEPWRVTASQARHLPQMGPLARASRTYFVQLPTDPTKAATVEITILDCTGNTSLLEKYADPSNPQKLVIDSMPAIRAPSGDEADKLEVVALNRFLITIVLKGSTTSKGEDWLKLVNFASLRTAASASGSFDPKKEFVLTVEMIDEINPKRTRKTLWSLGAEEESPRSDAP